MTLHLIKMAAGISTLQELEDRQTYLKTLNRPELKGHHLSSDQLVHITRFFPKRRDEITKDNVSNNGSLYWVFKKRIQARQTISDFIEVTGEDGLVRCGIVLQGPLVSVERQMRKAFQGWRYLPQDDVPNDLRGAQSLSADIPSTMRKDLEELCLI